MPVGRGDLASGENRLPALAQPEVRRHLLLLGAVTLLCLGPFAGKAFHIDDPLFLWAGKHIQSEPLNFFGFQVNWSGSLKPMFDVTRNPPLACYYIAAVTTLTGWSEFGLHLAFLAPALAAVWGCYFLAREFCGAPLVAALASVLCPASLVSATSVMCDTMMLAFWVWAVFLWVQGLERQKPAYLLAAASLVSAAALTKYFGVSLIPLLLAYSVYRERRVGAWAYPLLIPLVVLAGYELACLHLYGRPLLITAARYSTGIRGQQGAPYAARILTTLAFAGGGVLAAVFFSPLLWSWRKLALGVGSAAVVTVALTFFTRLGVHPLREGGGVRWSLVLHLGIFTVAGAHLLILCLMDLRRRGDASSVLLALWVFGTFVFCAFLNWSVNIRTVLPLVPAVGILIVRMLEDRRPRRKTKVLRQHLWPLVPAALSALLVTWADYRWAGSARDAAAEICRTYQDDARPIWFEGHWGFQYYMERGGGIAADWRSKPFAPGHVMVLPINNTGSFPIGDEPGRLRMIGAVHPAAWNGAATMSIPMGAGFYADIWGPLPFAIGRVPPERYRIYELK